MKKSESPHFFQTASALFLALQGPGKLKGLKIKKEVEYSTFVTESIRTMYREMEHFIVPCFFMVVVLAINSICGIRNGTLILVTIWLFFGPSVSNAGFFWTFQKKLKADPEKQFFPKTQANLLRNSRICQPKASFF